MNAHPITDGDIRTLQTHAEREQQRGATAPHTKVSAAECRAIRETTAGRNTLAREYGYSPSTIARHASGRCHHGGPGDE